MKIMKKITVAIVAVLTLVASSVTVFATTQYATPADTIAGLTGREVQSVIDEQIQSGKTYGSIASEAGILEEFKDAVYEIKEERLQELVDDGTITQTDADEILTIIKERQAICDGTGNNGATLDLGPKSGRGAGCHMGNSNGRGNGGARSNSGNGGRSGIGNGLRNGSCLYQ